MWAGGGAAPGDGNADDLTKMLSRAHDGYDICTLRRLSLRETIQLPSLATLTT